MRHRSVLAVFVGACGLPVPLVTPAEQATPSTAQVPGEECRIAPRSQIPCAPDHVLNVLLRGTPPPGVAPTSTPIRGGGGADDSVVAVDDLPDGPPVDSDTLAAVLATIRELAACIKAEPAAGGQVEALHTDDDLRRNTEILEITTPEAPGTSLDVTSDPPGPFDGPRINAAWRIAWLADDTAMPAIERVWWLPDTRVAAIVHAPGVGQCLFVFARDPKMGRYLIDEFGHLADTGTPIPSMGRRLGRL